MLPIYLILATNEERELFSLLWNKYSLKLLKRINIKVSNMSIAQELVSDTYVALMNNFNRYNDLSEEQLKAMLLTISDHLTINYLKKHSKINILSLHNENIDKNIEETEICDTSINVEKMVISKITVKEIEKIIEELDPIYSEILKLKLYVGLSNSEISKILNLKPQTIRKRFERAKKLIIKQLEKVRYYD